MSDDNLLDMEQEFRDKILTDEISRLQNEITKLYILLKEAGIEDIGLDMISDEEVILVTQIKNLREKSDYEDLSNTEIKSLDILIKNLRLVRGENTRVGRKSKLDEMSSKDLIKELGKSS